MGWGHKPSEANIIILHYKIAKVWLIFKVAHGSESAYTYGTTLTQVYSQVWVLAWVHEFLSAL